MLLLPHRPQMTSNHDLAIVTLFHSTLEHTLDHFLEFWIFEGVRHFLGLLNQPPTPLITLVRRSISERELLVVFFVSHQFRRLNRLDSMTLWQKVSLNRRLRSACANRAILISTRILATLNARGDIPPDDSISLLLRRCSSLNFLLATKLSSFLARHLGLRCHVSIGLAMPCAVSPTTNSDPATEWRRDNRPLISFSITITHSGTEKKTP